MDALTPPSAGGTMVAGVPSVPVVAGRSARVIWLFIGGAVLSAAVLAALLWKLRHDSMAAGERVLSAFAQVIAEQTSTTVLEVDQVLQAATRRIATATAAGTAGPEAMKAQFQDLLRDRPFLSAIRVIDRNGLIVFDSETETIGTDLSIRAYFQRRKANPGSGFTFDPPLRSGTTTDWVIPATRDLLASDGSFAGVIIALVDPLYFSRIWTLKDAGNDIIIHLLRRDGMRFMRSPYLEAAMGGSDSQIAQRFFSGSEAAGIYQNASIADGRLTLFAFRQIDTFPGLIVLVGQSVDSILAAWWHIVWIVAVGWLVAVCLLGGLAGWLFREWSARRETEARYRLLFDSSPFPAFVVDRKTLGFLAVNQAMIGHYGWSRDELRTMSANDFYPPEDLAAALAARSAFRAGATKALPTLRHRKKDGSIIDVDQTVRVIEFAGHAATLVTAYDMTERNRAQKELRTSEARYRMLVDTLPVGVVETNAAGGIVTANAAWRRMFGFGAEEDLDAIDFHTLYVNPGDRTAALSQAYGDEEMPLQLEVIFKRRDGTKFPAERYLHRVIDDDGKVSGLRAILIDITGRKELEGLLVQAQKMEAVGQLTGGIAHDFNNILMVIVANADALGEDEALAPAARESLDQIEKATQRAADLTRSLLAFSHKLPLQPRHTDINDLVVSTGKLLRRTLGAQIEIESILSDDLWPVEIDRGQLENALVNLCLNARDAMPGGGRLMIETRNNVVGKDYVVLDSGAGDCVVLSVTDNGAGMAPDVLKRVFEPFFTTKDVGQGTGLGLSMVHGFIKQSKGHIEVQSEPGVGTTITMYLPRSAGAPVAESKRAAAPMPRGSESILVVEDEARVRDVVVQQLQGLGYRVTEAPDGAAGLAAFDASPHAIDLLLTDIVMPGALNGKALAEAVRDRRQGTRVLFMSGYTADYIVHDGRLEAGTRLLNKPFRKVELAQAVRSALDGQ